MRFLVSDIVWDTDGEDVDLPTEWTMEVEDPEDIADELSDIFGWCVESFESYLL